MVYLQLGEQIIKTDSPHYWREATPLKKKDGEARYLEQERAKLREIFPPGSTVYTVLKHRSSNGMFRHIDVIGSGPRNITALVAEACGFRTVKNGSLGIGGCGMDMGFHVAYTISRILYRDRFTCIGKGCPSNDHFNGDRNYEPHEHSDGGYALRHSWL